MAAHETTVKWITEALQEISETAPPLQRLGRSWQPIAGFSRCGSILAIYRDATGFCAHAGETWEEGQEPLLGYYSGDLSRSDLISQIAQKYDAIRSGSH